MSFLSFLTKSGEIIKAAGGIAQLAQPIVTLLPGGPVINSVINAIVAAETLFPEPGSGQLKADAVVALLHKALPSIDPAKLHNAADHIVAAINVLSSPNSSPALQASGVVGGTSQTIGSNLGGTVAASQYAPWSTPPVSFEAVQGK